MKACATARRLTVAARPIGPPATACMHACMHRRKKGSGGTTDAPLTYHVMGGSEGTHEVLVSSSLSLPMSTGAARFLRGTELARARDAAAAVAGPRTRLVRGSTNRDEDVVVAFEGGPEEDEICQKRREEDAKKSKLS